MKCLANKIHLKERLYTFWIAEDTPIQSHLDEFDSILIYLENLDGKIEDEYLGGCLFSLSYKHLKEILLYNNNETLSFEDVKSNLLFKGKFDLEVHSDDKAMGLSMRGRSSKKWNNSNNNFRSKSEGCKTNKPIIFVRSKTFDC